MEKIKGIVWVKESIGSSKSDGKKAFLIDENFGHFQLYREGIFEVNDLYFDKFNLKEVIVIGEIQNEKWVMVEEIKTQMDNNENKR